MLCKLTEIKEVTVDGQLQKHFNAIAYDDNGEKFAEQTLIVSGDALDDPEAAFIDGLNSSTDDYVPSYTDNRVNAYPPITDQLDMIFHAGLGGDEFQATIQSVKDAYPKPTQ